MNAGSFDRTPSPRSAGQSGPPATSPAQIAGQPSRAQSPSDYGPRYRLGELLVMRGHITAEVP